MFEKREHDTQNRSILETRNEKQIFQKAGAHKYYLKGALEYRRLQVDEGA